MSNSYEFKRFNFKLAVSWSLTNGDEKNFFQKGNPKRITCSF